jgi:hypothetical protein
MVPAYRPSLKRWNLGLVVAYRNDTQEFCLLFDYTVQEYLTLDQAPFEAYTAFYRHCRQQVQQPSNEKPQKNAVSFDEFWPNDDMSWTSHNNYHNSYQHHTALKHHQLMTSNVNVPVAIDITHELSPHQDPPVLTEVHNNHSRFPVTSPIPMAATLKFGSNQLKTAPRHWSEAEDNLLLRAVSQAPLPLKWAVVASLVPNRSGKQCRERYFNHLHTKVKVTEWTPLEDALICRLYKVVGSKWIAISKLVPGRSDNSCKNRWHYLRRHLEKYVSSLPEDVHTGCASIKERLAAIVRAKGYAWDEMEKAATKALIHMINTQSTGTLPLPEYSFAFGPFVHPMEVMMCIRCGLVASSAQTGPICQHTQWCWACSLTSAVLQDDFLRLEHQIRATGPKRVSLDGQEQNVQNEQVKAKVL